MKKIVIDMHVHPAFLEPVCKTEYQNEFAKKMYGLYKTDQIPVDALLTLMDCSGVDKAVLLPLDLTTEYGGILGTNDQVKELTATYPDRFIGFASVDLGGRRIIKKKSEKKQRATKMFFLILHSRLKLKHFLINAKKKKKILLNIQ